MQLYVCTCFFLSISFISIPEARFEKKNKHIVQIDKHIAEAQIERKKK